MLYWNQSLRSISGATWHHKFSLWFDFKFSQPSMMEQSWNKYGRLAAGKQTECVEWEINSINIKRALKLIFFFCLFEAKLRKQNNDYDKPFSIIISSISRETIVEIKRIFYASIKIYPRIITFVNTMYVDK